MGFFLCVIGMVMIVEGIPYFAFPEKMKAVLLQMMRLPSARLRRFGAVLMFVGLALVYLGRRA